MSEKVPVPSAEELHRLHNTEKMTLSAIARMYGISQPTVRKWFKSLNISRDDHQAASAINTGKIRNQRAHEMLSNEQWIRKLFENRRVGIETVAKMAGCSVTIVKQYIKKFGITPANKYRPSEDAVDLYNNGMKVCEVAAQLNVSQSTAQRWLAGEEYDPRGTKDYPRSFTRRSKGEMEVADFLSSLNIEHKSCDRSSGVEFDIFVPSHNWALEFNGLYYHSEKCNKTREYHKNKSDIASKNGIRLFHLFEDQWRDKRDIVKSMIKHQLGLTSNRVFARQTKIVSVDSLTRRNFFNEHHLKGADASTVAYGLEHNGQLVSVMSFRSPRFNSSYTWELVRYAVMMETAVVGGFNKLLKHFRMNHKGSIVSYSDNTYSEGSIYRNSGFKHRTTNPPSYWYIDLNKGTRYPRTSFTKARLLKILGPKGNTTMTELELSQLIGLTRIWDAGTKQWGMD